MNLKLIAFAATTIGSANAQSPALRPAFEVASVKRNVSGEERAYLQATPGRLVIANIALKRLILSAYGLQDYQISGDPSWIAEEQYDIHATANGKASVQEMEGPMLQTLLEERFKLTLHRETRQFPIYELTLAKGGAKFHKAKEGECAPYVVDSPPPSMPAPDEVRPHYCGFSRLDGSALEGTGVTIGQLAMALSRQYSLSGLRRPVIDRTGLTGTFDFRLEWTPDQATVPLPDNATGSSVFSAIEEQLGLKLEPTKGPVEVLVIDHIEKPSGN